MSHAPHAGVRRFRSLRRNVFLCALLVAAGVRARASEGAFIPGLDTLHLQRAGGGVASPRSAAWMLVNPAGLVELGRRVDGSFFAAHANTELHPRGLTANWPAGELESDMWGTIPSLGLVWPRGRDRLAIGVYAPAASSTDFPEARDLPSRYVFGNEDRRLKYQHIRLVCAYAHEFDSGWAIGVGLHGSVSRLRTDHLTLDLTPTDGDYHWDEAPGFGFGLGLYKAWEHVSIGVGYASRHWVGPFEEYEDLLPYNVDLPQTVQAGIAVRPTKRIEVTADYKYIDWSDMGIFGTSVPANSLDWLGQHLFKLAVEYQATARVTLRAGWSHGKTQIDSDHVFVAALTPGTANDLLGLGVSWRVSPATTLHVGYMRIFPNTVEDTGVGDFFGAQARGTRLRTAADIFAVQYTLEF